MGYRIEYDSGTAVKGAVHRSMLKTRRILILLTAVVVTAFLVLPTVRRSLRDLLLPGDDTVTAQALQGLVEDLRAGEPVSEAMEVFCREIITNG